MTSSKKGRSTKTANQKNEINKKVDKKKKPKSEKLGLGKTRSAKRLQTGKEASKERKGIIKYPYKFNKWHKCYTHVLRHSKKSFREKATLGHRLIFKSKKTL